MTINGNLDLEYTNLAPISTVEWNAIANKVNPNDIDYNPQSDATMSVGAIEVEGGAPEEFILTLAPLVLAHVDFGDGEGDYFSPLATTGHPASASIYHTYPAGDGTYTVTVTADGYTPATAQVVIGAGARQAAPKKRAAKKK